MAQKLVKDLMHAGAITCHVQMQLRSLVRIMDERQLHGLPVVDSEGYLVGFISQTDLVHARGAVPRWQGQGWMNLTVERLMKRPVITVRPDDTLDVAIERLRDNNIHRLVVVRDEPNGQMCPIGILSMTDVVREMSRLSQESSEEAG
jgi:CBS-domain-containing membrane protein